MNVRDRSGYLALGGTKGTRHLSAGLNATEVTFEHKLKVNRIGLRAKPIFTESLILAQDERWRRA